MLRIKELEEADEGWEAWGEDPEGLLLAGDDVQRTPANRVRRPKGIGAAIKTIGGFHSGSPFGQTSKMPGPSYGLPASACKRGSKLAHDPTSMCHPSNCYAKRNFYKYYKPVLKNREAHLASLRNPGWVDAFVLLFRHFHPGEKWFRWHDSGDLQGVWHLDNIVQIARRLPDVRFWLPTHEPEMVVEWLRANGGFPSNLTVRVSADKIGGEWYSTNFAVWSTLRDFNIVFSSVHQENRHPMKDPFGRVSFECRAHDRQNTCGPCRACWSPNAGNISYPLTSGTRRGVRSEQLRIVL